jgi:hypothetical protein
MLKNGCKVLAFIHKGGHQSGPSILLCGNNSVGNEFLSRSYMVKIAKNFATALFTLIQCAFKINDSPKKAASTIGPRLQIGYSI